MNCQYVSNIGPLFLSDEGPTLETLDYTIRIGSTPTFLYFDLYLYSAYGKMISSEKNRKYHGYEKYSESGGDWILFFIVANENRTFLTNYKRV